MNNANELRQTLRNYTGSEQVYRHSLARLFNYTEGARAFFRNAGQGAYWLADILATEPSIIDPKEVHPFIADRKGYIEFKNVNFHYSGADEDVLQNITFTAKPGQTRLLLYLAQS